MQRRYYYEMACDAMDAGRFLHLPEHLIRYEDVEFLIMLRYAGKTLDLKRYIIPALSELHEYDSMYGTDYHNTLFHYIRTNSKKRTAKQLHIHKNTLAYRQQRISDILS